jgi:putative membrane protein
VSRVDDVTPWTRTAPRAMSANPRSVGRVVVLLAWTVFFVWLYVSGEMSRYLGPRTYWVVPFGAITLALATIVSSRTLRTADPRPMSWREIAGLLVLLVPMLAVLAVPRPDLGSLAASRKSQAGGIAAGVTQPVSSDSDEISFLEISYSQESAEYAAAVGAVDGAEVDLTGFVSSAEELPGGTFGLARFYVSCCAADAIPYTAAVDPGETSGASHEPDTWLHVSGTLERRGEDIVVVAEEVDETEEPEDPYLY